MAGQICSSPSHPSNSSQNVDMETINSLTSFFCFLFLYYWVLNLWCGRLSSSVLFIAILRCGWALNPHDCWAKSCDCNPSPNPNFDHRIWTAENKFWSSNPSLLVNNQVDLRPILSTKPSPWLIRKIENSITLYLSIIIRAPETRSVGADILEVNVVWRSKTRWHVLQI